MLFVYYLIRKESVYVCVCMCMCACVTDAFVLNYSDKKEKLEKYNGKLFYLSLIRPNDTKMRRLGTF